MSKKENGLPKEVEHLVASGDLNEPDGDGGQHQDIAGSVFDLTFKPSNQVTYRSILPQILKCGSSKLSLTSNGLLPQVLACLAAISFHFLIGLVVGYSAILLPALKNSTEIKINDEQGTWIASSTIMVVPLAALITGGMVDWIGRVSTLKAAAIPYVLGWLCIALASDVNWIYLGRVLTGTSLAMGTSPATVYITEIARPDLRGTLLCLGPTLTSFGMVLVYMAGWILHWRTVAWISISASFLPLLLMTIFSPESPKWLVSKGRTKDALKTFASIAQDSSKEEIHRQNLWRAERKNEIIRSQKTSIFRRIYLCLTKPSVLKPFLILSALFTFQQFSGIYIFIFYAVEFFDKMGIGNHVNSYAMAITVGMIRMSVGFITSQLLYKVGRRRLTLTSITAMIACIFVSAYFTQIVQEGKANDNWHSYVPIGCILLYICCSTMGLLTIPWTMTAEVYPMEIRGTMQGMTSCVAHILMFVAVKSYNRMLVIFGGTVGIQYFFGCVCICGFVFIKLFLPETHNRTLDDIEKYFTENTIYRGRKKEPADSSSETTQHIAKCLKPSPYFKDAGIAAHSKHSFCELKR